MQREQTERSQPVRAFRGHSYDLGLG
jgi:hypothetical protein